MKEIQVRIFLVFAFVAFHSKADAKEEWFLMERMIPVVNHAIGIGTKGQVIILDTDIEFWTIEIHQSGRTRYYKLERFRFRSHKGSLSIHHFEQEIELLRVKRGKEIEIAFIFRPAVHQKASCLLKATNVKEGMNITSLNCRDLQADRISFSLAPGDISSITFFDPKEGKVTINARKIYRAGPM